MVSTIPVEKWKVSGELCCGNRMEYPFSWAAPAAKVLSVGRIDALGTLPPDMLGTKFTVEEYRAGYG